MATHSSVLAWRIPGSAEPGGLPSMGSHSRTRLKRLSSSSMPRTYAPQQEKPPQWEAHVCNKEQPVLTITGENPRKSSEDLAQPPNLNINKNFFKKKQCICPHKCCSLHSLERNTIKSEQMDKLVSPIMHPEDRNKQITKQEMQPFHTASGENMGPSGQFGISLQITTN